MFANHHFLSHTGYLDIAVVTKPLLHMWSLAVEEQFYLLAPLTLLAMTAMTAKMKPEDRRRTWITVTFGDRKSTRLNSSHVEISYAVFCLKKKKKKKNKILLNKVR